MDKLVELLPFLVPIIIIQFILLGYTIYHILKHDNYKRGNRTLWLVIAIVGMAYVGPVAYLLLGKEEI